MPANVNTFGSLILPGHPWGEPVVFTSPQDQFPNQYWCLNPEINLNPRKRETHQNNSLLGPGKWGPDLFVWGVWLIMPLPTYMLTDMRSCRQAWQTDRQLNTVSKVSLCKCGYECKWEANKWVCASYRYQTHKQYIFQAKTTTPPPQVLARGANLMGDNFICKRPKEGQVCMQGGEGPSARGRGEHN